MKQYASQIKPYIKQFGRELDTKITYVISGVTTILGNEDLNSVTPNFQSSILKSAMKELEIDSNVDIPLETIVNLQFGVKTGQDFTYLDFGDYIVYSSEKQEDTNSYKIVCYDNMLKSMKTYVSLQNGNFPMTVREYLTNLCLDLDLEFANISDTFANYDRVIASDLYAGLGYTYRDIFDELSQVTASTICIDTNNKVEVRYINETNDVIDEEFLKDVNVNFGEKYGPVNSIVLTRAAESDSVYLRDEESVEENGLCEIKIKENQIMNFNDRSDYLEDILDKLDGLEYYLNDFDSTGVCYYDICDKYGVKIGDTTYNCIMFNDEVNITQGLSETVFTEKLEESETDYTKADKTDRRINQAYIIVDKQNQTIDALTSRVTTIDTTVATNYQNIQEQFEGYSTIGETAEIRTSVEQLQTDTYTKTEIQKIVTGIGEDGTEVTYVKNELVTVDENGTTWDKDTSNVKSNVDADGLKIIDKTGATEKNILEAIYDYDLGVTRVRGTHFEAQEYFVIGTHSRIEDYEDGTGIFIIG